MFQAEDIDMAAAQPADADAAAEEATDNNTSRRSFFKNKLDGGKPTLPVLA